MNLRALIPLLVFAACHESPRDPWPGALATWNVGLASGYVDHAAQRRPVVGDLLRTLDAEVVCLQEVWTAEDVEAIVAAVEDLYPHHHQVQLVDDSVGPASCSETEADPLVGCVNSHCAGVAASEIATCVLTHCRLEFDALGDPCTTCVVANIGKEVDEIIGLCKAGSARFTYGGANGLLLLSRLPLSNTSHLKLDSTNTQRSALAATVTMARLGDVAVLCTHLAADLSASGLAYTGPHASWAAENRAQAEAVLAFAKDYARSLTPVDRTVILGDLNSGPARPPVLAAELPEAAFGVFTAAGFLAFPSAIEPETCTFCADNLHIDDAAPSVQIDHILFDAFPTEAIAPAVSRIGVEAVEVVSGGRPVQTHPSDHFGVRIGFSELTASHEQSAP
jgi:endonuclease/exonuclease/phosphatase family metal-dependent hydrolase